MTDRLECEFFLLRYVPDLVKGEFVNIGVLLRPLGDAEHTALRFTRNWSRVRCLNADADIADLEGLESAFRRLLAEDGPQFMKSLEDSLSTTLQLTPARACLAESLAAQMEQLMGLYVEPRKRMAAARNSGRQAIHATMRTQFERAGVWDLMRKRIAAAAYTRAGDPLRIDCGYRPNGVVRMFHAVSLEGDLETAKVLAFSAAALRAGVRRVDGAGLELTAIVEPLSEVRGGLEEGDRTAQYRFAVETMEQDAIRVLTTSDMARVAEAARVDLRV